MRTGYIEGVKVVVPYIFCLQKFSKEYPLDEMIVLIGECLTEGQKYQLYMILVTQFIQGKFSDATINQLKQCGFKIYFRLTENEASEVSRQITYDTDDRKVLYKRLTSFPQGHCLLMGSHLIGNSTTPSEAVRFIEIFDEPDKTIKKATRTIIKIANPNRNKNRKITK